MWILQVWNVMQDMCFKVALQSHRLKKIRL